MASIRFGSLLALLLACGPGASHFELVATSGSPPVGRIVQAARPSTCRGATQPAIVDFDEARTPIWSCLRACKPGQELVTEVSDLRSSESTIQLVARCHSLCPTGTRRRAYIELSDPSHDHCEPGAAPREQADEQARITDDYAARLSNDYDKVSALVGDVERRPLPWDDGALDAYERASSAVRRFAEDWDNNGDAHDLAERLSRRNRLTPGRGGEYRAALRRQETREAAMRGAEYDRKAAADQIAHAHAACENVLMWCLYRCPSVGGDACQLCKRDHADCEKAVP
jgi:hypothetical protein